MKRRTHILAGDAPALRDGAPAGHPDARRHQDCVQAGQAPELFRAPATRSSCGCGASQYAQVQGGQDTRSGHIWPPHAAFVDGETRTANRKEQRGSARCRYDNTRTEHGGLSHHPSSPPNGKPYGRKPAGLRWLPRNNQHYQGDHHEVPLTTTPSSQCHCWQTGLYSHSVDRSGTAQRVPGQPAQRVLPNGRTRGNRVRMTEKAQPTCADTTPNHRNTSEEGHPSPPRCCQPGHRALLKGCCPGPQAAPPPSDRHHCMPGRLQETTMVPLCTTHGPCRESGLDNSLEASAKCHPCPPAHITEPMSPIAHRASPPHTFLLSLSTDGLSCGPLPQPGHCAEAGPAICGSTNSNTPEPGLGRPPGCTRKKSYGNHHI
jgi:hypothetical protein